MNKYEMMYVLAPNLSESDNQALHEEIEGLVTARGTVLDREHIGLKRLAYEINFFKDGDYCVMQFAADGNAPREIQEELRVNENILRYMIISLEDQEA